MLVDTHIQRAIDLATRHGMPDVVCEYTEIIGEVDAAIITLPNYLHAPTTVDLLQHNIHVLVEKPMALNTRECDEMIKASRLRDAVLAVGMIRRFNKSQQFVKHLIEDGVLGDIVEFDLREGTIFDWPVASDFMFHAKSAGGGVLTDIGVHALDLLLWWLGDYESVQYYDDALGGVEADCKLHLRMQCGASGIVELSRVRNLRNTCVIVGERGTLEIEVGPDGFAEPLLTLKFRGEDLGLAGRVPWCDGIRKPGLELFRLQLDNFADALLFGVAPFVTGQEGRSAIELIETCYASRQPLEQPWMYAKTSPRNMLKR